MNYTFDRALELVRNNPDNLDIIKSILMDSVYTESELTRLAIEAIDVHECVCQWSDDYDRKLSAYDPAFIRTMENAVLVDVLKEFLNHGLNPNCCIESEIAEHVLEAVTDLYEPFLDAALIKLLLEHGLDPEIDYDGESFFRNLDGSIAIDISLCGNEMVNAWVLQWFLFVGYGARPEKVPPFTLVEGHSYDELKNYKDFDYYIEYDDNVKENVMHIYNIRTKEEIGYL